MSPQARASPGHHRANNVGLAGSRSERCLVLIGVLIGVMIAAIITIEPFRNLVWINATPWPLGYSCF